MRWLLAILIVLFIGLQYRIWVGEGSYAELAQLKREMNKQLAENTYLKERNRLLMIEVEDLKNGEDAIEARARKDMGMVKKDETFFMLNSTEN